MIGFFDSGIGGLTVLKEAMKQMPLESYIYYADSDNVPYSYKTKDEIKRFVFNAVEFLIEKGSKAIVLACNTATNVAIEDLRKIYSLPIIAIQPAVKPAILNNKEGKRILVCATPITLTSNRFDNLVATFDTLNLVDRMPLPGLVELAEGFIFDEKRVEDYLKDSLKNIDLTKYGFIVLGCTHFTFFQKNFKQMAPHIQLIDGNVGTINHLKNTLNNLGILATENEFKIEFYESGRRVQSEKFEKYLDLL